MKFEDLFNYILTARDFFYVVKQYPKIIKSYSIHLRIMLIYPESEIKFFHKFTILKH